MLTHEQLKSLQVGDTIWYAAVWVDKKPEIRRVKYSGHNIDHKDNAETRIYYNNSSSGLNYHFFMTQEEAVKGVITNYEETESFLKKEIETLQNRIEKNRESKAAWISENNL